MKKVVDLIRKPLAPPTKPHKDKNQYTRKQKHKKGFDNEQPTRY